MKPFRIQKLSVLTFILPPLRIAYNHLFRFELSKGIGNDSSLLGLLRVYQEHYPGIVTGRGGKAAVFEVPDQRLRALESMLTCLQPLDREWQDKVQAIQLIDRQSFINVGLQYSTFRVLRRGAKSTGNIIPEVQTYHAEEVCLLDSIWENL